MNAFEKVIYALQFSAERPTNYSLFHIVFLILTVILSVLFVLFFRNAKQKTVDRILLVFWLIILIFEIYKQLVFNYSYKDGVSKWDYAWYAFPFQFCSSPLYVLPLAVFVKNQKFKEVCYSFISSFVLFGGLAVMLYPNDVFATDILGVQIQTMVHHGLMVVMGVYMLAYNRNKLGLKFYLKGLYVLAGFIIVALILDAIVPLFIDETFNMFFISKKYPCTLPVLSAIYPKVPYVAFVLIYAVGFSFVGLLISSIAIGITKLCMKLKK